MTSPFHSFLRFDASRISRADLRQWLVQGVKLLEPAVITPGNVDRFVFDQLEKLFQRIIEGIQREETSWIVGSDSALALGGEQPVTLQEIQQYLARFPAIPEASRELLYAQPRLLQRLQRFSESDQQLITSHPLLLLVVQLLLPVLLELLLNRFRENANSMP